jgi:hypothetical protein
MTSALLAVAFLGLYWLTTVPSVWEEMIKVEMESGATLPEARLRAGWLQFRSLGMALFCAISGAAS